MTFQDDAVTPYNKDRDRNDVSGNMPDLFDRTIGGLQGIPDTVHTRPTVVRSVQPIIGDAQTFIVQTYRQNEVGDTIFLECTSKQGSMRLVIPPKVAAVIARQYDSLGGKMRSKTAKRLAQERKDRGELPGFMRKKKESA